MSEITFYWNRKPGVFVNKKTGEKFQITLIEGGVRGPAFTGTVREWYETLVETIIDVRNHLHRDAGKNSREINVYVSPDVRCILESSVLFKPNDKNGGTLCGMNVIQSRSVPRFEVEVEFKTGSAIERGRVVITED